VALYPSLDIEKCASVVQEKLYESEITFANLQWKEIMLYLRYMMTDEQLRERQLYNHAPKRRWRRGRPPLFHASGSSNDSETRRGPWDFTECLEPNDDQTRRMWCIAVEILVTKTMQNHCYMFEGQIYRQEEGGSIGLDLTGVVSDIYMSWWDVRLIDLLRGARYLMMMYVRYVDDINMVLEVEEEIDEERDGPRDGQVMEKVRRIADTIHPSTKTTCDYGSKYDDNKLPMLDIKLWTGLSDGERKILYEHYMKDVSSRHVINYLSAHPEEMKINVLVNEALRILRNCSRHLPDEVKTSHLQYLVNRMQFSGYPQAYRHEVIARAFRRHRNRNGGDGARRRRTDKRTWYDKNRYDGVMFVDTTPNGELKKRVEQVCRKNRVKIKVVEKITGTVKKELQRSNPFGHQHCKRNDCVTCNLNLSINCRKRGPVYEMYCMDCKVAVGKTEKSYMGQTGRTTYHRMKEHFSKWERRAEDSVLHKHSVQCHEEERFEVGIKLIASCYGKPTTRLITEAIHIEDIPEENSMNEKTEWNYVRLPRVGMVEWFEVGIKLIASCYGKPTTRLITEAIHIEDIPEENSMNEKTEWNYVRLPRVGMVE
jgi:hypothetical protein